ncbi:hypothetical protein C8R45DRAFT_1104201 [Mycena sanguinolenta]|nr:hypothetical protein C8R45DRAFT_1104201 [Mycena sanguinolenta]
MAHGSRRCLRGEFPAQLGAALLTAVTLAAGRCLQDFHILVGASIAVTIAACPHFLTCTVRTPRSSSTPIPCIHPRTWSVPTHFGPAPCLISSALAAAFSGMRSLPALVLAAALRFRVPAGQFHVRYSLFNFPGVLFASRHTIPTWCFSLLTVATPPDFRICPLSRSLFISSLYPACPLHAGTPTYLVSLE